MPANSASLSPTSIPFHPLPSPVLFIPSRSSYLRCSDSLSSAGGFSETYAALCDYNGIGCKEEVQWVRTLSHAAQKLFCQLLMCCALESHSKLVFMWLLSDLLLSFLFPSVSPLMAPLFLSVSGCRHHLPLSGQQRIQFTGFQPPRQQVTHFISDFRNDSKHAAIKIWLLVLKWKNHFWIDLCKILKNI